MRTFDRNCPTCEDAGLCILLDKYGDCPSCGYMESEDPELMDRCEECQEFEKDCQCGDDDVYDPKLDMMVSIYEINGRIQ